MTNLESILKSRVITLPVKVCLVKAVIFPVVMVRVGTSGRLRAKELMLLICDVGEDSWESLDSKEIKPVNPNRNQPWIFFGRTDAEAEAPVLWPPDVKSQLTGKAPDAGKDWGQEEKGVMEGEMVGWRHWLDGYESESVSH